MKSSQLSQLYVYDSAPTCSFHTYFIGKEAAPCLLQLEAIHDSAPTYLFHTCFISKKAAPCLLQLSQLYTIQHKLFISYILHQQASSISSATVKSAIHDSAPTCLFHTYFISKEATSRLLQ